MKVRISIYAKIAGLFLANVIVLALLLGWIVRQQWGISALPTFRSDKLEKVGETLFRELDQLPPSEWDGLLAKASQEHGVTFYLYSIDGPRLAGPADFLPGNVHSEITGGIGDRRRPPPLGEDFGGRQPPPPPPEPPRQQTDEKPRNGVNPRPILSAADGYWSLTQGTLKQVQDPWKVALVTRSESPTGNGFYTNTLGIYWLCAAMLIISLLVWLPFIHSAMRSLRRMQSTAGKLAAGDFTARANERRNDELGALGHSVNHMADQIGSLVDGQKRLLGDIAHELSSPIARMQAVLGILESTGGQDNREKYMTKLDGELQQMGALVQELLSLSKASLRRSIELRPIPLRQHIERIVEREKQNGEVVVVEVPEEIVVLGEPELLSRAIGNVLRNAIRYAGKAGPITLQATRANEETLITISDLGPGVSEDSLPRIFDAFYRPDIARTRETGGNGLGLAIVKTCIEAMHGRVTARNRSGGGLVVEMTLLCE